MHNSDDVAGRHPLVAWADLMADGVHLVQARRGESVADHPVAWNARTRTGRSRCWQADRCSSPKGRCQLCAGRVVDAVV